MKIRIGLFFGGPSVEHEVSVITAMQALAALDKEKYQPVPVYVTKEGLLYTGEAAAKLESYRSLPALISKLTRVDMVREDDLPTLMRHGRKRFGSNVISPLDVALLLFHGTGGEDGSYQGFLEQLGLPYTGCDVTASAIGMDKWAMKALFAAAQIPHLPAVKIRREDWYTDDAPLAQRAEREIGYPCIVKPVNLGSSVGISRAANRHALNAALDTAFQYAQAALVERAVTPLREINCAVLGDASSAKASVCEEPLLAGEVLTFHDKYQRGTKSEGGPAAAPSGAKGDGMASLSRRIPADLPEETAERIQQMAVDAFHAIGAAGVARVDFLMDADSGELWVNEINTIPGSMSFYLWEASGLPYGQLLDSLVDLALKRQRDRARVTFSFDTNLLQTARIGGKQGNKS